MFKFLLFSLFPLLLLSSSTLEGIVKLSALTKFKDQVLPKIFAHFSTISIPDMKQGDLTLSNIRISNLFIDTAQTQMIFTSPNKIVLSTNSLSVQVDADYKYKVWIVSTHGSVDAKALNIALNVGVSVFLNEQKKLQLNTDSIDVHIGGFDIKISGDILAKFLNFVKGLFENKIKGFVEQNVAKVLKTQAVQKLNEFANKLPNEVPIGNFGVSLDYTPEQVPNFFEDRLELEVPAFVYDNKIPKERPPIPQPAALSGAAGKDDVSILISDYLLNSATYATWKAGLFKFVLTDSIIPKQSPVRLNTDALEFIFSGITSKFGKNKTVDFSCEASSYPVFLFKPENFSVVGNLICDGLVDSKDRAFTIVLNVSFAIDPYLSDDNTLLKAKIINDNIDDFEVTNTNLSVQTFTLKTLLNLGLKIGVPVLQAKIFDKGFPIPTVPGVKLENVTLNMTKDVLIVEATPDFKDLPVQVGFK